MGSGITTLHSIIDEKPYILEKIREEYTDIFLNEIIKLNENNNNNSHNNNNNNNSLFYIIFMFI